MLPSAFTIVRMKEFAGFLAQRQAAPLQPTQAPASGSPQRTVRTLDRTGQPSFPLLSVSNRLLQRVTRGVPDERDAR